MAIQFGNIDRELADRQNVIKEDAARQYRGSRDMMQSVTDLGDTISREVKEYKANKRADQRLDYKFRRDEENAKIRGEQHNMNLMKTELYANKEMRERSLQSYNLKKWPYGKEATKDRFDSELKSWRETDIIDPLDKIYAFGSLYSEEALRAVRIHQTIMNSKDGFKEEGGEAASLKKIRQFRPVKMQQWAINNKYYDPTDYGDPTAEADADATNIINKYMRGMITDANEFVDRTKSSLTLTRYSAGGEVPTSSSSIPAAENKQEDKFNKLLDEMHANKQVVPEVQETTTGDGVVTETTDNTNNKVQVGTKIFETPNYKEEQANKKPLEEPGWWNYLSVLGQQKIKAYKNRDMTNELILNREPFKTTNLESSHNLRVLEGFSNGEMVDDNTKIIAAGSVDANGLVNKSPKQVDTLINMLGITDPAKKKEWESYLMSGNVNSDYGYIKPGSNTEPWEWVSKGLITDEQLQKRSLLKLNPDQVNKLQGWAYKKSIRELSDKHSHLKAGKKEKDSFNDIPYLKHILGDMGFRHGSSFMVKKEGDTGRYPKFGNAVKELTEADGQDEQLAAWNKMDKELFSTGIYSKGKEGKSGEETKRFRFLRDRMDRLKKWITDGQYYGLRYKWVNGSWTRF